MSGCRKRQLRTWIDFETKHASGAIDLTAHDSDEASLLARVDQANYRLAEALLRSKGGEGDFIQEVRTKIGRGFVREAEAMLSAALAVRPNDGGAVHQDILTELARVHYACGDYEKGIETVSRALHFPDMPGLVRLTFLQIRSVCWFELGEWRKCSADIEAIRSLQLLYPKAQSAFYSEVLAVKVGAREWTSPMTENRFQWLLEHYFVRKPRRNADTLLTLLRLRIDLNRFIRAPIVDLARACYFLSEAMGDGLYSALAILDLRFGESASLRIESDRRLRDLRGSFDKVALLLDDASSEHPRSTTAKTLALPYPASAVDPAPGIASGPRSIVLAGSGIRVDLETLRVRVLHLQERTRRLLFALAAGPLPREELFFRAWGMRFRAERHDVILRNALLRARKQTGCSIVSRDGSVEAEETSILGV